MVSPESAEPISPPKILPLLALSGSVTPSLLLLQSVNIRPPILSTIFDSGDDMDDDDMDDEVEGDAVVDVDVDADADWSSLLAAKLSSFLNISVTAT